METLDSLQELQFKKISENYEEMSQAKLGQRLKAITRERYRPLLTGKRVLDVGNGGLSPEWLLGAELYRSTALFVASDVSFEMLNRERAQHPRVTTHDFELPFHDKSFDYVLLNGVLHHLGYEAGKSNSVKLSRLLVELRRISRSGILVYEIFLSPLWEWAEKCAALVLRQLPTFVWSEGSLNSVLKNLNIRMEQRERYSTSELTSAFYREPLFLELPQLKIPAWAIPLRHIFFNLNWDESSPLPSFSTKNPSIRELLACPSCKNSLELQNDSEHCPRCQKNYPMSNGIYRFNSSPNSANEA